jgi:hypothetical protein
MTAFLQAGRKRLQQISPRPDGPDGETYFGKPLAKPKHVGVEGIATRARSTLTDARPT